ncbi:GntR family transcriptional regulator [Dactylosporangium sp. NPDC051485]|uniref:GntR family transcriptional regulator n=1 Tax=Dactylosporangium sp. NPDC051485 TaxID=3154846 RepID=UPI003438F9A8
MSLKREPAPAVAEPLQLTLEATAQIRGLIIDRVLLPGEKIRQVDLAERIGVSRSPLREALRTLESEGVVSYEANRGYVVARLDDDDLAQIYRMRALLEDELLRTVTRPDPAVLSALKDLNERMMTGIDERNVTEVLRCNREFHFLIFDLSPLNQFRREVRRLWQMSEGYSATWWWRQPEARKHIDTEHKAIISLLRKFDLDGLVDMCAKHRVGGLERSVSGVKGGAARWRIGG